MKRRFVSAAPYVMLSDSALICVFEYLPVAVHRKLALASMRCYRQSLHARIYDVVHAAEFPLEDLPHLRRFQWLYGYPRTSDEVLRWQKHGLPVRGLCFRDHENNVMKWNRLEVLIKQLDALPLKCMAIDIWAQGVFASKVLPDRLTSLSYIANHPIQPGCLPASLQKLTLDTYSENLSAGVLPESLRELHLLGFYKELGEHLPRQLEVLRMPTYCGWPDASTIPETVKVLDISNLRTPTYTGQGVSVLPPQLRELVIRGEAQQFILPNGLSAFPPTLTLLKITMDLTQTLLPGTLPASLRTLYLQTVDAPLVAGSLPEGLLSLEIVDLRQRLYDPQQRPVLPSTLYRLKIKQAYTFPLYTPDEHRVFPDSLRRLVLSGVQSLRTPSGKMVLPEQLLLLNITPTVLFTLFPGDLPSQMQELILNSWPVALWTPGTLPEGLRSLVLGHYFQWTLTPELLPASIEKMVVQFRHQVSFDVQDMPNLQSLTVLQS